MIYILNFFCLIFTSQIVFSLCHIMCAVFCHRCSLHSFSFYYHFEFLLNLNSKWKPVSGMGPKLKCGNKDNRICGCSATPKITSIARQSQMKALLGKNCFSLFWWKAWFHFHGKTDRDGQHNNVRRQSIIEIYSQCYYWSSQAMGTQ